LNGVGFTIGAGGFSADLRFGAHYGLLNVAGDPWIPDWSLPDVWIDVTGSEAYKASEAWKAENITTSAELPGSTHWDPAPVPVGDAGGGRPSNSGVVLEAGSPIPWMDIPRWFPGERDESQPPVIYRPPPILLPGQTDPGREEHETEEEDMAHTWTHLGSQIVGALFPNTVMEQSFVAGPGQVAVGNGNGGGATNGQLGPFDPGPGATAMQYEAGSCARKTRTLTIDCATGLEVKRKRRRRRALLTQGDMGVLFQIASLPNNANVRVALAGAIRR